MDMISQCKMHDYHGVQFETRRAEWARKGMYVFIIYYYLFSYGSFWLGNV
jgi:hypothetical protein